MVTARIRLFLGALPVALAVSACGGGGGDTASPPGPYDGTPPLGLAIAPTEGIDTGAPGWKWIPFGDAFCTDLDLRTSTTGLAISWGTSSDLVVFLAGGGACWDYLTCAFGAASTGPFGAAEFKADVYDQYPSSWVHRDKLPAAIAGATIVYVPYCTGDVHTGDKVTTYAYPGLPPLTWHHVGHANLMSFLKRLGATFPTPGKLIVAGSSAGGFGALANYPAFRWYWKDAKSYLVDDSAPPLVRDAIPADSRAKWYQNWGMGSTLDAFCKECRTDMSAGMANLKKLYPDDRIALLSYVQDLTIREFFGTFTITPPSVTPMDATSFETELRLLGSTIVDPPATSGSARYFFTKGTGHPLLIPDPSAIATPSPGLAAWLELMLSDDTTWASATD